MVTRRQLKRIKDKFPFKLGGVYVFDEIKGQLFDSKGREVNKEKVGKLSEQNNVIVIIDDIGG